LIERARSIQKDFFLRSKKKKGRNKIEKWPTEKEKREPCP
jgi:hypothetical protein